MARYQTAIRTKTVHTKWDLLRVPLLTLGEGIPVFRWAKEGTERRSHLLKVTQWKAGGGETAASA